MLPLPRFVSTLQALFSPATLHVSTLHVSTFLGLFGREENPFDAFVQPESYPLEEGIT